GKEVVRQIAIEDHLDVFVARLPWVLEELRNLAGVEIGELVANLVESAAERASPGLAPTVLSAHLAAAIALPALEAVGAAPGAVLGDLRLVPRREELEGLAEVDELEVLAALQVPQGGGEHLVAALLVVAEGLAVDRDDEQFVVGAGIVEPLLQPRDQIVPGGERLAEGHRAGDRSVVEEDRDAAAAADVHEVRQRGIELRIAGVLPGTRLVAHANALIGREDGEADPLVEQRAQRIGVGGGLGQPHPFGVAAETLAEVGQAPADLRPAVALVAERKDGVRVRLRDGVAVAPGADAVG